MKIMILTDIPPCTDFTAGLVVNKWCDFLLEDGNEVSCVLVKNPLLKFTIPADKKEKIKFVEISKPEEYWGLPDGVIFKKIRENLRSLVFNNFSALFVLPKIAEKISESIKEFGPEIIFASVQGQTMTRLVRRVSFETGIPYVAQTWDPLEWWLKEHRFDFISRAINLKEFSKMAKGARTFASMSWAMSNEFEKEYGAKCVTNIPGLDSGKMPKNKVKNKNEYIIGFAGQLYAKEELNVLIRALQKMEWKYKGNKISLHLYGKAFDIGIKNTKGVKTMDYVNQEKLLKILASTDLLYCPYWFSKDFEKPCRISFPSKLTSYLKTGVPVLMHSPEYASPRIFLEEYSAAYFCDTLRIGDMIKTLKHAIEERGKNNVGGKGYELFERYMTYETMKKSFLVSLGLLDSKVIQEFESVRNIYK